MRTETGSDLVITGTGSGASDVTDGGTAGDDTTGGASVRAPHAVLRKTSTTTTVVRTGLIPT
ncbi:hypothetical protein GCM10029964_056760 [Kibdelosporangium lantanae]